MRRTDARGRIHARAQTCPNLVKRGRQQQRPADVFINKRPMGDVPAAGREHCERFPRAGPREWPMGHASGWSGARGASLEPGPKYF
eukprot:15436204-Alexandrium_andersonii.AAC.1